MEDAHRRQGQERWVCCQGSPGSHVVFLVHKQNRVFVIFVFLKGSSVRLNYWSRVYHCHVGKLIQVMFASYSAVLNSIFPALRAGIV